MGLYEVWKEGFWNPLELYAIYRKCNKISYNRFLNKLNKRVSKKKKEKGPNGTYKGVSICEWCKPEDIENALTEISAYENQNKSILNKELDLQTANQIIKIFNPNTKRLESLIHGIQDSNYIESGKVKVRTLAYIYASHDEKIFEEVRKSEESKTNRDSNSADSQLVERIKYLESELKNKSSEINEIEKKLSKKENELFAKDKELLEKDSQLEKKNNYITDQDKQLKKVNDYLIELEIKAIEISQSQETEKISSDKIKTLEDQIDQTYIPQIQSLKTELDAEKEEYKQLESMYESSDSQNTKLKETIDRQNSEIEKYKAKVIELFEELDKYKSKSEKDEEKIEEAKNIEIKASTEITIDQSYNQDSKLEEKISQISESVSEQSEILEETDLLVDKLTKKENNKNRTYKDIISKIYSGSFNSKEKEKKLISELDIKEVEYSNDSLKAIIAESSQYELTDAEEQSILIEALQNPQTPKREIGLITNALVCTNLKYFIKRGFSSDVNTEDITDIINQGIESFIENMKHLEVNPEYRAPEQLNRRISRGIKNSIYDIQHGGTIKRSKIELVNRIKRIQIEAEQRSGKILTPEELSQELNKPLKTIKNALEFKGAVSSDVLVDTSESSSNVEEEAAKLEQKNIMLELMEDLDERSKLIFSYLAEGKSMSEIGRILGMTKANVSRIKIKESEKLQKLLKERMFKRMNDLL